MGRDLRETIGSDHTAKTTGSKVMKNSEQTASRGMTSFGAGTTGLVGI